MTKKLKEIEKEVAHDNLIQLLSLQTPAERQKLLQDIDGIAVASGPGLIVKGKKGALL